MVVASNYCHFVDSVLPAVIQLVNSTLSLQQWLVCESAHRPPWCPLPHHISGAMYFVNFLTLFLSLSIDTLLLCWPFLISSSFFLFHLWVIFCMAKANKKAGLSNTVKVQWGRGNNRAPIDHLLHVNKSTQQLEKDHCKRWDYACGKLYLIPSILHSPNRSYRDEFWKLGYRLMAWPRHHYGRAKYISREWWWLGRYWRLPYPSSWWRNHVHKQRWGEGDVFHEIIDYVLPTKYDMIHLPYAY